MNKIEITILQEDWDKAISSPAKACNCVISQAIKRVSGEKITFASFRLYETKTKRFHSEQSEARMIASNFDRMKYYSKLNPNGVVGKNLLFKIEEIHE